MSPFDPQSFMDSQITEANSTVRTLVPAGDYPSVITDIAVRPWQSRDDPEKAGLALDVKWELEATPALLERLGRDNNPVLTQGIMLDLTQDGGLDMGKGKNVPLGKLREALGLNAPGTPFNFRMLVGKRGLAKVSHTTDKGRPGELFDKVTAVARPAR